MSEKKNTNRGETSKENQSYKNKTKEELIEEIQKIQLEKEKLKTEINESKDTGYYKDFYEYMPLGYQSLDENGKIIDVNRQWLNILGYKREEIIGRWFGDFLVPEYVELFKKRFFTFKEEGKIHDEIYMIHKNGSKVCIEFEACAVLNKYGSYKLSHCMLIDKTKHKTVEDELQRSNSRLQAVMNSIESFIYIADMQTYELLFVNEYGLRSWGHNIVGQKCWQALQNLDGPCSFCTNDKLLDENGMPTGVYQWEFQNKVNQKWYFIKDCAIQWTDGRIVRMEIATDITECKQVEIALRESEKQYKELIDGMSETVWIIGFDGDLIDVNRTAIETLGYSKEELLSIGIFGVDFSLKKEEISVLAKTMPLDKVQKFESAHKCKDGRVFSVEIYSSLITYHGEKAILSIARDITDRKKAEKDLSEKTALLEAELNSSIEGILIVDSNGKKILQNKRTIELWEIPQHIADDQADD